METPAPAVPSAGDPPGPRARFGLGLGGLFVAAVGLALAVARPSIAEALEPPPPPPAESEKLSEVLAEAGEKFVGRMLAKVRRKKAEAPMPEPPPARPPGRPWLLYVSIAAGGLGLVGSLSGLAGWVRRENPRMAVAAMATGFLAMSWVYIALGLVVGAALFVLIVLIGMSGSVA